MKQSNLRKLERYLFNHLSHNYKAAFFMADIIGVLIGAKPSCMRVVSEKDLYKPFACRIGVLLSIGFVPLRYYPREHMRAQQK